MGDFKRLTNLAKVSYIVREKMRFVSEEPAGHGKMLSVDHSFETNIIKTTTITTFL